MPTGYTAGILDGEIKTFQEFAKLCARAFGATIHMRDDSMNEEFKPRTPSEYHINALAEARKAISSANLISNQELIADEESKLLKEKEHTLTSIEKIKENYTRLVAFLNGAEAWEPPTQDHTGVKEFMIQQIKETIRFDGSTKYHDERLAEIEDKLKNLNAINIRAGRIAKANEDIAYHTKEHNAELERCAKSNKWIEDYFNSLETKSTA